MCGCQQTNTGTFQCAYQGIAKQTRTGDIAERLDTFLLAPEPGETEVPAVGNVDGMDRTHGILQGVPQTHPGKNTLRTLRQRNAALVVVRLFVDAERVCFNNGHVESGAPQRQCQAGADQPAAHDKHIGMTGLFAHVIRSLQAIRPSISSTVLGVALLRTS